MNYYPPRRDPNGSTQAWTDDRVEQLKKLWADGLSGSQIADELGGVSRSAVIGKVHRLGLGGRVPGARRSPRKPRVNGPRVKPGALSLRSGLAHLQVATRAPAPEPDVPSDPEIPVEQRRTLLQLTSETCRWPVGDPRQPGFFFCGAAAKGTYCEHHIRRAGSGYGSVGLSRLASAA